MNDPNVAYATRLRHSQVKAIRALSERTRIPQTALMQEAAELLLVAHAFGEADAALALAKADRP